MIELAKLSAFELGRLSQQLSSQIKLIFFDIDGTLLDSKIAVPSGAVEQIRRLHRCGVNMAIASGRPYFAARYFTNELSLDGAGLFCTGAMLYEPKQSKVLAQYFLAKSDVSNLIDWARKLNVHCELYTEQDYFIERKTQYSSYHAEYLGQEAQVASFENLLRSDDEILKALLAYDGLVGLEKYRQISTALPHFHYAHGHGADRPEIYFTSIVSDQVNKQAAFSQLCRQHGVTASQVLSIGDGDSDTDFISAAGVGIAMGNAKTVVKEHSDYICKAVDMGGLEEVLALLQP